MDTNQFPFEVFIEQALPKCLHEFFTSQYMLTVDETPAQAEARRDKIRNVMADKIVAVTHTLSGTTAPLAIATLAHALYHIFLGMISRGEIDPVVLATMKLQYNLRRGRA